MPTTWGNARNRRVKTSLGCANMEQRKLCVLGEIEAQVQRGNTGYTQRGNYF